MQPLIESMRDEKSIEGVKAPRPEISKTKGVDEELQDLLASKKTAIKVVGVGGAGITWPAASVRNVPRLPSRAIARQPCRARR